MENSVIYQNRIQTPQKSPSIFTGFGFEKEKDPYQVDIFEFLSDYAPQRKAMLKRILAKIKFYFKGNLVVDIARFGFGRGGYYNLEDTIAISPMAILFGDEREIAHIFVHEGIHAGVYTDGVEVHDEVLTETMTKKFIKQLYGTPSFNSVYDEDVDKVSEYFDGESFTELVGKIDDGDEETFDNILNMVVLKPMLLRVQATSLNFDTVQQELQQKWNTLLRLFPRIINSIAERKVGPHEGAKMSVASYKLEGLLEKLAEELLTFHRDQLKQILAHVVKDFNSLIISETVKQRLYDEGYGFLIDFAERDLKDMLEEFVIEFNTDISHKIDYLKIDPALLQTAA